MVIFHSVSVPISPMSSNRNETDNFECIMEIMNVPVLESLREIFKQEWDKLYGTTKGVWDDTCILGNELFNMEKTNPAARPYLQVFKFGNRSNWDISALSYAILYSKALKLYVPAHVNNNVDVLRDLRNKLTHSIAPHYKMSDVAFGNVYRIIKNCFNALSLSTADVERVRNSRRRRPSLRSRYLTGVCLAVFIVGLSYFWAANPVRDKFLFRVLPTRPGHLIVNRSRTVHAILDKLSNLSNSNNRALTYMYISGPQGSGRSQIARLVGQQYGENISQGWFGGIVFVMTINGRSLLHVLNSYVEFAYHVNCDKNVIDIILYSNQNKTEDKVKSILSEIVKKLENVNNKYTCLMIVLNVLKLSEISPFLPQLEDKSWQGGQVLITTQDISSVPSNGSLTVHISVSQGMEPAESCKFLTDLSGLFENQDLVSEVANKLDNQPLALVSAALYVKQLRDSKVQITWKDYLTKLDEEKRNLSEMKQSESKEVSSSTAYAAVSLAVRWIGENDSVMKNAFTFISYVSHEPVPLYSVEAFVLHVDRDAFKTDQRIQQCSLILSLDDGQILSISLHPIVHKIINLYISNYVKEDKNLPRIVLQMLVLPRLPFLGQYYISHLKSFYKRASSLPMDMLIPKLMDLRINMCDRLFYFARILERNDEISLFKYYRDLCFWIHSATD